MDALVELAEMGRALGGARWVQGPGGNVSVKTDRELVVKASGVRLRAVGTDRGHARVPLEDALAALEGDEEADARVFARTPRPSLETYFHALPGRAIAHTHALGVLLHACRARRGARPNGVTGEVAYARPGRGLAVAIGSASTRDDEEQAIVLLSHGLLVIAPNGPRAVARTEAVDDAIRASFGTVAPFEPMMETYLSAPATAVDGGWLRALPPRRTNATRTSPPRYLFPDAVICASTRLVETLGDAVALAASSIVEAKGRSHVLSDGERRVLVAKGASQLDESTEVLAAHDWLEDALRDDGGAAYLGDDEPAGLLGLGSEQYRIRLSAEQR